MNALSLLAFQLPHRTERVTNISPASDAFVLFTLATLFSTIGCFAVWMWIIWRKGKESRARETDSDDEQRSADPVARLPDNSEAEDEKQPAPWEKPADWWKK